MKRLVLVSNRVADLRRVRQAGGVAVVLADIIRKREALWFGWSGDIVGDDESPAVEHAGPVVAAPLTAAQHEGYYLGYANSVLWPVFHNRLDLAQFEAGYFDRYMEVNRQFAQHLLPLLRPDDTLWVHDYHLIPFASELRALGVENPIGFYLHIPFPPWQTFMAIPEHQQLARSLAAYDLVGLQTRADVANLCDYATNSGCGRIVPSGRFRMFDRLVTVASFPVGIDVGDFTGLGKHDAGLPPIDNVKRVIGVDRLDYTKGLPHKFRAFGKFLDAYPEYRGRAILTQIAPPTRDTVMAYADIRKELESLAGSINGKFSDLHWVPIHYIHRAAARRRLPAIYRSSHVAMVTPLRDGMNLVAKEYVAAQDPADPGVLILSQFAGAAEEMAEALVVNPYSIDETAAVLHKALEMERDERVARHAALFDRVRKNDVRTWYQSFVDALERARSPQPMQTAVDDLHKPPATERPGTTRPRRASHQPAPKRLRSALPLPVSRAPAEPKNGNADPHYAESAEES